VKAKKQSCREIQKKFDETIRVVDYGEVVV
jgi:hypothetical protein